MSLNLNVAASGKDQGLCRRKRVEDSLQELYLPPAEIKNVKTTNLGKRRTDITKTK